MCNFNYLDFKDSPTCSFVGQCTKDNNDNIAHVGRKRIINRNNREQKELDSDVCLKLCMSVPGARACEWRDNGDCAVLMNDVVEGNGKEGFQCTALKECRGKYLVITFVGSQ